MRAGTIVETVERGREAREWMVMGKKRRERKGGGESREKRRGGEGSGGEGRGLRGVGEVKETEVLINIYRELNEFGDWKKLRHCGIQDLPIYC